MLILITIITIIVLGIAWYVAYKYDEKHTSRYYDDLSIPKIIAIILSNVLGLVFIIHVFCACVAWIPKIAEGKAVGYKIEMYEKENAEIESDVEKIVEQYCKHETATFNMSEINSATTLVQMYPELKSDKLVMKQIEIYKENNDAIKQLKIDKINCQKAKWWLYFGSIEVDEEKGK